MTDYKVEAVMKVELMHLYVPVWEEPLLVIESEEVKNETVETNTTNTTLSEEVIDFHLETNELSSEEQEKEIKGKKPEF